MVDVQFVQWVPAHYRVKYTEPHVAIGVPIFGGPRHGHCDEFFYRLPGLQLPAGHVLPIGAHMVIYLKFGSLWRGMVAGVIPHEVDDERVVHGPPRKLGHGFEVKRDNYRAHTGHLVGPQPIFVAEPSIVLFKPPRAIVNAGVNNHLPRPPP